jgi:hypothetical protein
MRIIMHVSPAERREIKDERCARTNAAGEERRKGSRKGATRLCDD